MENAISVAPSNHEEALRNSILALYKKLLQVDDLDENSAFYQHGGTSLSATLLLAELVSEHGVTLSFDEFDKNNTPATLSTKLSSRKGGERAPSFERRSSYGRTEFELSAPQRSRSWYLGGFRAERAGDDGMYNSGYATWLTGRVDWASLERALNLVARQHDLLGASYAVQENDRLAQTFGAHVPIEVRIEAAPASIREAYAARPSDTDDLHVGDIDVVTAFIHAPFDWAKGETLRCRVYTLSETEYLFLLAGNHIAFDLMSRGIFLRDVVATYDALIDGQSRTARRPAQYRDYLEWERRYTESGAYAENLGYWIKYLSGSEQDVQLPAAAARAKARSEGERYHQDKAYVTLGGALTQRIKAAAKAHTVTPYVVLFTAFAVTLARLSRQQRLTIGTQIANRRQQEALEICGCFAQPVALVCDLRSAADAETAFRAVQKDLNAAIEHQPVSLPAIAEAMQREGHERRHPLYPCSFEYFEAQPQPLSLYGVEAQEVLIPYHFGRTSHEVMFLLWERPHGMSGALLYARELHTREAMDAFANTYVAVLEELLKGEVRT